MEGRKPILWNRNFVQCCISYFLMNFSFYMLMPTMPVYLVEVLGIDTANVGIVLSSYTVGLLCVRPFSGFLVDCFSRKPLYLFAFFVFAFMFGGYLVATTMLAIMAVRFIQGGFMGLTSVAGNTIAIDVIPSSRRGEGAYFGDTHPAISVISTQFVSYKMALGCKFIISFLNSHLLSQNDAKSVQFCPGSHQQ